MLPLTLSFRKYILFNKWDVASEYVELLLNIPEIPSSNLDMEIDYPELVLFCVGGYKEF
jgi:hypothetical protein